VSDDDFGVLIESLGETVVGYLKPLGLRRLEIEGDHVSGTAHLTICLTEDSWEHRGMALEKLLDIRVMFIDELAMEFSFTDDVDGCTAGVREPDYQFA
jgi:hypothetical protein